MLLLLHVMYGTKRIASSHPAGLLAQWACNQGWDVTDAAQAW